MEQGRRHVGRRTGYCRSQSQRHNAVRAVGVAFGPSLAVSYRLIGFYEKPPTDWVYCLGKESLRVFVAASTSSYSDLPLADAMERLADLRFTYVEIDIHEQGTHLKPSEIAQDAERAIAMSRPSQRLTTCAYSFDTDATGEAFLDQFKSICRLAKATKVVTIVVRAAELGTPFNEEVERLRDMVGIASLEGIVVGMKTEAGRMSEDPSTITTLCENVKGLGLTLDPSHFVCGPLQGGDYDSILKYVCHVQLRDSTKEELQVRVGQGEIEYGRLASQLAKEGYRRALCADIGPNPDTDQDGEMRKLRLLLESLL